MDRFATGTEEREMIKAQKAAGLEACSAKTKKENQLGN